MPKVSEYIGASGKPKYVATWDDQIANKHPSSNDGSDEHSRHAAIAAVNSGSVNLTVAGKGVDASGVRAHPATSQKTNKGFRGQPDAANPNYGN